MTAVSLSASTPVLDMRLIAKSFVGCGTLFLSQVRGPLSSMDYDETYTEHKGHRVAVNEVLICRAVGNMELCFYFQSLWITYKVVTAMDLGL